MEVLLHKRTNVLDAFDIFRRFDSCKGKRRDKYELPAYSSSRSSNLDESQQVSAISPVLLAIMFVLMSRLT